MQSVLVGGVRPFWESTGASLNVDSSTENSWATKEASQLLRECKQYLDARPQVPQNASPESEENPREYRDVEPQGIPLSEERDRPSHVSSDDSGTVILQQLFWIKAHRPVHKWRLHSRTWERVQLLLRPRNRRQRRVRSVRVFSIVRHEADTSSRPPNKDLCNFLIPVFQPADPSLTEEQKRALALIHTHQAMSLNEFVSRFRERHGRLPEHTGRLMVWLSKISPEVMIIGQRIVRMEPEDVPAISDPGSPIPEEPPPKRSKAETSIEPVPEERSGKKPFRLTTFKQILAKTDISVTMSYFWEYFDSVRCSIWLCEYKYPERLVSISDSVIHIYDMSNQLGLFWRKTFASMCLFRVDTRLSISGVWISRSPELLHNGRTLQSEFEGYSWTKLDTANECTRKMVHEYCGLAGDFGGKELLKGMLFQ